MSAAVALLLTVAVDQIPEDDDVVAGWTAFAVFGLLIVAVVVLGFSLTKRLKNTAKAADQGLYDPSDPRPQRPARGLAAARQMREQAAREQPQEQAEEQAGEQDQTPG
ncbi:hypothetical protein [Nocardioides sp.]|uniref:hypothetical protein n=1 Tax=Nocardioides sp. TaxID=35761 RepID=UPI00321AED33